MSSKIQKTYDWLPKDPEDVTTGPFLSVIVEGVGVILVVKTWNVTTALAAFLDFGKYPIFLAKETTFSLNVALSMNTSFATIFALYEVM